MIDLRALADHLEKQNQYVSEIKYVYESGHPLDQEIVLKVKTRIDHTYTGQYIGPWSN